MSFSYAKTAPADEIRSDIKNGPETSVPKALRDFIMWRIHEAKEKGSDNWMTVECSGHTDPGALEVHLKIVKAVPPKVAAPAPAAKPLEAAPPAQPVAPPAKV